MPQRIDTYPARPKAAHRYEVVKSAPIKDLAGRQFHFIGAGGIGMSGLAKLLLKNGAQVAGSDQEQTSVTEELCRMGARIEIGHAIDRVPQSLDAAVVSAAVREDNPEYQEIVERGCAIYKYAEMLGELMNHYEGIAIAGTHGKSTTTAWLTFVLEECGLSPNFIVGADVPQLSGSSGTGDGHYFVAEACEYDRSFLNLRPRVAAILNIEQDHLDYYTDEREIIGAFSDFAERLPADGLLVANSQGANVNEVLARLRPDICYVTFGLDSSCDFSAYNIELDDGLYCFDIYRGQELLGRTRIALPGLHNISNALAVAAIAIGIGVEPAQVIGSLGDFSGIDRRLMLKAEVNGVTVLDDYAHHPTEIRASLQAIRQRYEPKRLWCVFQPHQYSRTRFLLDDFAQSFKLADATIVPEIYFVRDTQESKQKVNAARLVERIRSAGSEAMFIDSFGAICDYLKTNIESEDLIVTMGAGDIWKVADEYIQWLRTNS